MSDGDETDGDDLAFPYADIWYIKLRSETDKRALESWGGYSQDFQAAECVYSHAEVLESSHEWWGMVGVKGEDRYLLSFDIDVHKAPHEFDVDLVQVPTNTLIVRSQSGGLHVHTIVHSPQGVGKESDFEMTYDLGFDIDIRGSYVKHHTVAPNAIPGVGGLYELKNDESMVVYQNPADAAERIRYLGDDESEREHGEALLAYRPGRSRHSGGVDIDRDVEPPEEMPMCYHRGLQVRAENIDENVNTHKVNVLTALCGLAAGYSTNEMVRHLCDEFPPGENADESETTYQLKHLATGGYSPPTISTLREYGILDEGETCECAIEYHGGTGATETLTDGGTTAMTPTNVSAGDGLLGRDESRSLAEQVHDLVLAYEADDDMKQRVVIHRTAALITEEYHFVHPPENANGWRSVLYRYNADEGVYEPDGERFVQELGEELLGEFLTNKQTSELVGKIERRSGVNAGELEAPPHRLVVGNGVLNLHTGELDPWSPDEFHRTKLNTEWPDDPESAECPHIDTFFRSLVDTKDVPTLYQLAAHTLYREYIAEKAAMLVGDGENGKSVFLDFLERFLGGENVSHRSLQHLDGNDFAANRLEGRLANFHTDMDDETVKNLGTFKQLTGRDMIDADVKFEKPIAFRNYATMIFSANRIPAMDEDTHGLWRRWIYLKFPNEFKEGDEGYVPKDELMRRITDESELQGLLVRCVEEIKAWHEGRSFFTHTDTPEQVREKMKRASEPIYNFVSVCLEHEPDNAIPKEDVRRCYREYAREEGLPTIAPNVFGEKMLNIRDFPIEHGQPTIDGRQVRSYKGVRFTSRGRQVLGLDAPTDENGDSGTRQTSVDEGGPEGWRYSVLTALQELGGRKDPVRRDVAIGYAVAHGLEMDQAEHAFGNLKDRGTVYSPADSDDDEFMLS